MTHVWIVEVYDVYTRRYEWRNDIQETRRLARIKKRHLEKTYPGMEYRVAKYERVKP